MNEPTLSVKEQKKKALEHLSNDDIDRYLGRGMSATELLAANDHLTDCDTCYDRFGGEHLQEAYDLAQQTLQGAEDEQNADEPEDSSAAGTA